MKTVLRFFCVLYCLGFLSFSGCDFLKRLTPSKEVAPVKRPAIVVETMKPLKRDIIDYEEFTGKTEAVDRVTIEAQVSGILTKCDFQEGGVVTKDAVLFEIEPELYQAAFETAVGNLESAKGELATLKAREPQLRVEKERNEKLVASKAVSKSNFDEALATHNECLAKIQKGEADIVKAQAGVLEAEINLKYTKILSPINGYISRKLVTEGNLVQSHSTQLAQIVSLNPIYVLFYVDETTFLQLVENEKKRAATNAGDKSSDLSIEYRLTNEETFTNEKNEPLHTGIVQYTDPIMDESSGTVLLRATCSNPITEGGVPNGIIPGITVHIRIPVTDRYTAILIPEEALGTEQGSPFVYVADGNGKAQMRHLELGPLQSDNMRVIRKGLKLDDTVIVSGLLRLRPGAEIEAKETTLEKLREGI